MKTSIDILVIYASPFNFDIGRWQISFINPRGDVSERGAKFRAVIITFHYLAVYLQKAALIKHFDAPFFDHPLQQLLPLQKTSIPDIFSSIDHDNETNNFSFFSNQLFQ